MKILFISHSSVIPTYREKLRLLALHKNLEITLLLPRFWPEAGKRVASSDQPSDKEGFRIISAPILFEGRVKRHFYPFFSQYIRQIQPDLIHIEEEPYSWAAWQAARAAREREIPLVFFTWENLLEQFPFPHQIIQRWVLRTAAHAIAGDTEAAELLEKAGYDADQISVIPQYGVNPKLFQKKNVALLKKSLKLSPFTVGYVGRLVTEKGLHHLLEAFARLAVLASTLLMVGNGPLRKELEEKALQLGIAPKIRWVPAMNQPQIPDYLNCMDVLVLPSLTTPQWKEQFGRVLIEAQACEVPVVGSDSGAIPEVIGKAGLIYPEGNAAKLAAKLYQLENSKTLRKKLGLMGRKQVLSRYTNQIIADKLFKIYTRIARQKR